MQPRDRLTAKEVQVATLVWQGLTNKDIARVLITSEQVVKNYLRTTFDKLGVWTRLELALYVASHGGANWYLQLGNGLLSPAPDLERPNGAGRRVLRRCGNQSRSSGRRNSLERSGDPSGDRISNAGLRSPDVRCSFHLVSF